MIRGQVTYGKGIKPKFRYRFKKHEGEAKHDDAEEPDQGHMQKCARHEAKDDDDEQADTPRQEEESEQPAKASKLDDDEQTEGLQAKHDEEEQADTAKHNEDEASDTVKNDEDEQAELEQLETGEGGKHDDGKNEEAELEQLEKGEGGKHDDGKKRECTKKCKKKALSKGKASARGKPKALAKGDAKAKGQPKAKAKCKPKGKAKAQAKRELHSATMGRLILSKGKVKTELCAIDPSGRRQHVVTVEARASPYHQQLVEALALFAVGEPTATKDDLRGMRLLKLQELRQQQL